MVIVAENLIVFAIAISTKLIPATTSKALPL